MTATAVVDANVVFADRNQSDSFHKPATAIMDAAERGDLPRLRILSHNLAEALASIQKRTSWARAVETLQYLKRTTRYEVVHPARIDQKEGQVVFTRERELEFPDAMTWAYMNRVGLRYIYSFDDDFDRFENVSRLNAPENPFAA